MTDPIPRLNAALEGRYRIERELGRGGMATVYLADDLKHERKVALKVLKPELAAVVGAERFLAEIKTTANLQHPHILPLHDSGEASGLLFYVMPFVEGETLRARLDREHQLPLDDAMRIATNMAEALDYAHRHGVIHRDIKPANVLLLDGKPVISDFGIALAVGVAGGGRLTETGLSLGTPHYMSPEQATGDQNVGPATDIYALGCVLYEMLVGEPPYTGISAQAVLGKIIAGERPSARKARPAVPSHVDGVIAKALEKLPADRFHTAAEVSGALANRAFSYGGATAGAEVVAGQERWKGATLALAVALSAMTVVALRPNDTDELARVSRYVVNLPPGQELTGRVAITPDGSRLAYVGGEAGSERVWIRPLDRLEGFPLTGTGGAREAIFFSPDGERLAFFSAFRVLSVVPADGGPVVRLADSLVAYSGGTWGIDGYLYTDGLGSAPLVRISQSGGSPQWFTTLDSTSSELDHFYPDALPNGRGIVFTVGYWTGAADRMIAVADTETGRHRILFPGVFARYAPTGHLVYVTADGALMAVPFDEDAQSVAGEPAVLANGIPLRQFDIPDLSLSRDGTLFYSIGGITGSLGEPVWVDRDGRVEPIADGWTHAGADVALSPDGSQLVVEINEAGQSHLWLRTLQTGALSRLTLEGDNSSATWAQDGTELTFVTEGADGIDLYRRPVRGGAPRELLNLDNPVPDGLLTPDGSWIVYREGIGGSADLYARRVDGDEAPVPIATSDGVVEVSPTVSPDGRWIAFVSDATGTLEVHVRPFPEASSGGWVVSAGGGTEPVWARDGNELFYKDGRQQLVAVEVTADESFSIGGQTELFSTQQYRSSSQRALYDVSPDGRRFAMIRVLEGTADSNKQLVVVENFFTELERLAPTR